MDSWSCKNRGNEIADKLSKEAAEEAENMPKVHTPLTFVDIKKAVKDLQDKEAEKIGCFTDRKTHV